MVFNMMDSAACHCGKKATWVMGDVHPILGHVPTDTVCGPHVIPGRNAIRIEDSKLNTTRISESYQER